MNHIFVALAAAGLFTASAAAFDNTTCSAFLVGEWESESPMGMIELKLKEGGTLTMMVMPKEGTAQTEERTWTAKPGAAADQCALTAIAKGKEEKPGDTAAVTVKDENTIVFAELGEFKRQ